ncbi:uncharacterized protein F5147DRAFT_773010 [Suillus discolor]|uniref:Uncharacterized protein n=1 Tax=Suillus discolor TaxID=1912936 RepID=A0A9P7F9D4_9AGAM|nr:uncharacterized protein F5147DRAFT_773010 [Suillus discolor]KAG2109725.1 hypothetical protein F5147DRAFT_773010 [Suillus discolor]
MTYTHFRPCQQGYVAGAPAGLENRPLKRARSKDNGGQWVAVGGADRMVCVWDVESGRALYKYQNTGTSRQTFSKLVHIKGRIKAIQEHLTHFNPISEPALAPSISILVPSVPTEFKGLLGPEDIETPYYAEVVSVLKSVFGLTSFRQNQLEAINVLRTCSSVGSKGLGFSSCAAPLTRVCAPNFRGLLDDVRRLSDESGVQCPMHGNSGGRSGTRDKTNPDDVRTRKETTEDYQR